MPRPRHYPSRKPRQSTGAADPFVPSADPSLRRVFAQIGVPAPRPFAPDRFQLEALATVGRADCLVTAPTGSGKTWIAEQAIARALEDGGRAWYACPLKALSNAKHAEFSARFGPERVGILTGDRKENPEAPVIVGTTEILRNQLWGMRSAGSSGRRS
ncbi:MAG: DEAD/DEAH box helicase [Desulfobacterales bacterium]|nr:DEAD/DEAH box helicase [Desulfobacterales bacterium]